VQTSESLFDSLRRFVWPKYREEGPPEFVQSILLGRDILGEGVKLDAPTRSILEMMTIGYRPVTSLAILQVLSDTPGLAIHGMQIGRELEKRFRVQDGWFTRTRYYTDRVGKLLPLLGKLGLIMEVPRRDAKTGRTFTVYSINPSRKAPVSARLESIAKGENLLLVPFQQPQNPTPISAEVAKRCRSCNIMSNSPVARHCEICGDPLEVTCRNCKATVEAVYNYCVSCGAKMF